jgi:hypothetical protein
MVTLSRELERNSKGSLCSGWALGNLELELDVESPLGGKPKVSIMGKMLISGARIQKHGGRSRAASAGVASCPKASQDLCDRAD